MAASIKESKSPPEAYSVYSDKRLGEDIPTAYSVYSQGDLETFYPRSHYEGKSIPKGAQLFYVMIHNAGQALSYIDGLVAKDRFDILTHSGADELRPLHVAVLLGKIALVGKLLHAFKTRKIDLNTKDCYGWTALHHAAVREPAIAEVMKKEFEAAGANIRARTPIGSTYQHIQILTGRLRAKQQQKIFYHDGNRSRSIDFTKPETFPPGVESMRECPLYRTRAALQVLWKAQPSTNRNYIATIKPFLDTYLRNTPSIEIRPEMGLDGVHSLGLVSLRAHRPGNILTVYGGECLPNLPIPKDLEEKMSWEFSNHTHIVTELDGLHERGGATFVNWGFPNARLVPFSNRGVPHLLLQALVPIKQGAPIYINYGINHPDAFAPMTLLGKEGMKRYFGKGLKALVNQAQEELDRFSAEREHTHCSYYRAEAAHIRTLYPMENPTACLYLHFEGIVTVKEWHALMTNCKEGCKLYKAIRHIMNQSRYEKNVFIDLLKRVIAYEAQAKKMPAAFQQAVKGWVIEHLETYGVMSILKGLDVTRERLEKGDTLTVDAWQGLIRELNLASYDWKFDETAPLSKARRTPIIERAHTPAQDTAVRKQIEDLGGLEALMISGAASSSADIPLMGDIQRAMDFLAGRQLN